MKLRVIIKSLFSYPGKILSWLIDGRYHNVTIIISIISLCYFFNVINYKAKIIGTTFLVIGLAIIVWQMMGDSKRFLEQNPNTFKNWIKKFPKFVNRPNVINISGSIISVTGFKARMRVSIPDEASIEDKIKFLLKQKEETETAINNLDDKLDNKISEVDKKIEEVKSLLEDAKKIINSTISEIAVGNFDLKILSIWLMIWGTLFQVFTE